MKTVAALFSEHGNYVRASADEQIIVRGNSQTRVFQLKSGHVLIHSTSSRGRDIGIRIVKPNGIFGLTSIIKEINSIVDATALTDCELIFIDREILQRAVRTNSEIACEVLMHVTGLLLDRTRQFEELALHSLKSRLARWLVQTFQEKEVELQIGATVQIDESQRLIAAMAGVSRETVNRQLRKWVEAGIVEISGKNLRLLNAQALQRLIR